MTRKKILKRGRKAGRPAAVIDTFHRSPYLNRLLHAMLNDRASGTDSARQISDFFVKPLVRLQRRLLLQGVRAGAFRAVNPMHFYVSTMGACDLLFNARFTLSSVFGIRNITDAIRKRYIDHVVNLLLHGISAGQTRLQKSRAKKNSGGARGDAQTLLLDFRRRTEVLAASL